MLPVNLELGGLSAGESVPGLTFVRVRFGVVRPQSGCMGQDPRIVTPNRWWNITCRHVGWARKTVRGPSLGLKLGGWSWVSEVHVEVSDRDGTRPTDVDGEGDERGTHGRNFPPSKA